MQVKNGVFTLAPGPKIEGIQYYKEFYKMDLIENILNFLKIARHVLF